MHMPPPAAEGPILEAEPTLQTSLLLKAVAPEQWPVPTTAFPAGSALVGGAVRDALLGRLSPTPDLDLIVPDGALHTARQLAKSYGGACVVLDQARDMARLVVQGWTIDLARQEGPNLEADLQRRDYRINAIALELGSSPRLVDPTGGLADLKAGLLTAVGEHNLIDDPLRLLRGIRIAAELGFTIATSTWSLLQRHSHRLPHAAPERIQAELTKLVQAPAADQAMDQLRSSQLLQPWSMPDAEAAVGPGSQLEQHSSLLTTEERQLALPLLRLTQLLSDDGLKQLRFSRRQIHRCCQLRRWLSQDDGQSFASLTPEERLRLHSELAADLPALILQLPQASQGQWLERWRNPDDRLFHPRSPLDGNTLQKELNIAPGPLLGRLLRHLALEQAFGRLSSQKVALATARAWLQDEGQASADAPASRPRCD